MALELTINVQFDPPTVVKWQAGSLRVRETINARTTFEAGILSLDGSYRPQIDEIVTLTDGATTLFGGYITKTKEAGAGNLGLTPIVTTFDAADWNSIPDRRFVFDGYASIFFPAGQTAKQRVINFVAGYLAEFGVTLDPGMADGAVLGAGGYAGTKLADAMTDVGSTAAPGGWFWNISPDMVLSYTVPGLVSAPTPVWEGDLTVEPDNSQYANNVLAMFGDGQRDIIDETHAGDGATRIFPVLYPIVSWLGSGVLIVNESGVDTDSYTIGPESAAGTMGWTYWDSDKSLHQLSSLPFVSVAGHIRYSYRAQFPMTIRRQDLGEMAIHSTWETIRTYPDVFDLTTAEALADAALAKAIVIPRRVVGTTRTHGMHPGQGITLNFPTRNLNSTFLVESVEWTDRANQIFYTVTMVEGSTVMPNFMNDYKSILSVGGSAASSSSTGGGFVVFPGTPTRASYPLGGSMFAAVRSNSGPSLTQALGGQVQLDSAALAGASVTAVVTCRTAHAGISVTPKIVDVTHGHAVVGTGSSVTGVTPTTVVFTVTPGSGVCFYELWLLGSAINEDLFASGYLETGR